MDLRQIQYFVALFEEGSMTKAARRLNVVQPAVTMQVRRLESSYGIVLFERTPQGVYPNAYARALYPLCRETLLNAQRVQNMLSESSGKIVGELTVGVPPSLTLGGLADVLVAFHSENPGLQVRIQEGYSGRLLDWLISGELDFAIVNFVDGERRLHYDHLTTEELVVLISPETPWLSATIRGADLAELNLILPSTRNSLRTMIESNFNHAGITLAPAIEVDSLIAISNMIRHPHWSSILPLSAVPMNSGLRILKLVNPSIVRSLTIARLPQRELSPAAQLLIGHLNRLYRTAS